MEIGTLQSTLDAHGTYHRSFSIRAGGQSFDMTMNVIPDDTGQWKQIDIQNPSGGSYHAVRDGATARYADRGVEKSVALSGDEVVFDDYGNIWEGVMLKRYDLAKRGPQAFKRFRIPETPLPGNIVDVIVEYLGEESRTIGGIHRTFQLFRWECLGQRATCWVDQDYRVYLVDSPEQQGVSVRAGYEELMKQATSKTSIMVPMRDGILLATDLYRPRNASTRVPLILIRTPYNKETMAGLGERFATRGYAVALQDVRGRFASQGIFEPYMHEAADGYDAIEWLAGQEWCTGRVGMLGGSYDALCQFLAAAAHPPHLVTIIPNNVPGHPFCNSPFEYGSFLMTPNLWWSAAIENNVTGVTHPRFAEIERIKSDSRTSRLPVIDLDTAIVEHEISYWRDWIRHGLDTSYWSKSQYLEALKDLRIPVFLHSGWYDTQANGTRLAYDALRVSRSPMVKLLIGPWNHAGQVPRTPATRTAAQDGSVDVLYMYDRWLDRWLMGSGTGVDSEASVQLYILNGGGWKQATSYPLPGTETVKYYLSSMNGANTLKGDGSLVRTIPDGSNECDRFLYDPSDPTPAPAYRFANGRHGFEEITSTRRDILVYESEPLERSLILLGPIRATLYASTTGTDTDWFVTLYAVSENNEHVQMVRGTIRARFRRSLEHPEPLRPGAVEEYPIDLWHFGIQLSKGWKLRVEVASAYFPEFSRNLNTGGNNEMETRSMPAEQKVFHTAQYPSHISLPIAPIE